MLFPTTRFFAEMEKNLVGTKIILNHAEIDRVTIEDAIHRFLRDCKLRNLSPHTLTYYKEDLDYFEKHCPLEFIDQINQDVYEEFIVKEMDSGKKVTSLNSRIRGLRVFFKFCAEREYMAGFKIKLLKENQEIKEPYTDAELARLLARPHTTIWSDWRMWAAVNYMVATGNRVSTLLNVKISDVDFSANTIHLRTTKNRRQQIIPLSKSLKNVLKDYLRTWEHTIDDYLFPSQEGGQLARSSFQQGLARYNKSRGVTKTSAHLFRHTFAKNFILAGGGIIQLQALLGHSTMDMTRHYVNIYGADLQKNYDSLNPLDTFNRRKKEQNKINER